MTRREQRALGRYVRFVADQLGLREWTFHLDWDEPPRDDKPDAAASIKCIESRKHAVLRWAEDFRSYEPDKQRHYVVHELLHCHLEGMWVMVDDDLQSHLGRPAWDLFHRSFERAMEFSVDGLADVLAPRMPLIDWEG